MKSKLIFFIFLLTILFASGCISPTPISTPVIIIKENTEIISVLPTSVSTPSPTPSPLPTFNTTLWKYTGDCTNTGFIGSCNPQMYITPHNEVVEYYSSQMEIINGKLQWKEENDLKKGGIFLNFYATDKEQFSIDDYWQNPDYYLTHGMRGDCEDSAFAVASILEHKGIKTKIVGGWLIVDNEKVRDWIVEYKIDNTTYWYFGNGIQGITFIGKNMFYQYKDLGTQKIDFEPVLMFGYRSYYEHY